MPKQTFLVIVFFCLYTTVFFSHCIWMEPFETFRLLDEPHAVTQWFVLLDLEMNRNVIFLYIVCTKKIRLIRVSVCNCGDVQIKNKLVWSLAKVTSYACSTVIHEHSVYQRCRPLFFYIFTSHRRNSWLALTDTRGTPVKNHSSASSYAVYSNSGPRRNSLLDRLRDCSEVETLALEWAWCSLSRSPGSCSQRRRWRSSAGMRRWPVATGSRQSPTWRRQRCFWWADCSWAGTRLPPPTCWPGIERAPVPLHQHTRR